MMVSEKTRYDSKIGEFYKEVIYTDYEDYTYDYRVRNKSIPKKKYVHTFIFDGTNGIDGLQMPYQFATK